MSVTRSRALRFHSVLTNIINLSTKFSAVIVSSSAGVRYPRLCSILNNVFRMRYIFLPSSEMFTVAIVCRVVC